MLLIAYIQCGTNKTKCFFKAELGSIFSKNRIFFSVEDKLSPVIQHGFLRSAENVDLHNFM